MGLKTVAIFFAGACAGAAITRFLLKEKYEKMLDEELDKVNKELNNEIERIFETESFQNETKKDEEEVKTFKHEIAKQNYDAFFSKGSEESPAETPITPHIISANEFATDRAHDKITLTYYVNADIVCEEDEALDNNIEELLGSDWKDGFHEGEDGVVYVRNEKLGADYEVLLDESDADYVRESLGFGG